MNVRSTISAVITLALFGLFGSITAPSQAQATTTIYGAAAVPAWLNPPFYSWWPFCIVHVSNDCGGSWTVGTDATSSWFLWVPGGHTYQVWAESLYLSPAYRSDLVTV